MPVIRRVALICLAALSSSAFLAAKPNFSGEWVMNATKSDFGPIPAPTKMVRTIKHEDPELQIKNQQSGAQGEITSELKYTTDGKEVTNTTRGGEVKGTCKWDGDALVIESKRTIQSMEITQADRWSMGADGKSMKVESTLKTPQGDFNITIAFDKQ